MGIVHCMAASVIDHHQPLAANITLCDSVELRRKFAESVLCFTDKSFKLHVIGSKIRQGKAGDGTSTGYCSKAE
jgi:hypothetical protein